MRLGVLGHAGGWYTADLRRAAGHDFELLPLQFTELGAWLSRADQGICAGDTPLADLSAVIVRTMPPGTLEQVVFRMNVLAQAESAGTVIVNPPRALEIAVDKYLALAKLRAAGLLTPCTWVGQSADRAQQAFADLGGDVVVKPVFGSEGRGLVRVTDPDLAWRTFKTLERLGSVLYLQEFIAHPGYDVRVLWVGSQGWAIRRCHATDWRTNVSRGAVAERCPLTDELRLLSRRAADAAGAHVVGVDLLPTCDGRWFVLEVNAVPGWRGLAAAHQVDIARAVLQHVAGVVRSRTAG